MPRRDYLFVEKQEIEIYASLEATLLEKIGLEYG
jgi:hypothetical protein